MSYFNGDADIMYRERMKGIIEFLKSQKKTREEIGEIFLERCSECYHVPNGDDLAYHEMHDGWVIQGCEGYWPYDPALVGIDSPNWDDFRQGIDDMDYWKQTGIS